MLIGSFTPIISCLVLACLFILQGLLHTIHFVIKVFNKTLFRCFRANKFGNRSGNVPKKSITGFFFIMEGFLFISVFDCLFVCWLVGWFVCLFVWGILSNSKSLHSHGDVKIAGEGLQILTHNRHLWPLSSEGSLACHTYCDTGVLTFIMVISEDP